MDTPDVRVVAQIKAACSHVTAVQSLWSWLQSQTINASILFFESRHIDWLKCHTLYPWQSLPNVSAVTGPGHRPLRLSAHAWRDQYASAAAPLQTFIFHGVSCREEPTTFTDTCGSSGSISWQSRRILQLSDMTTCQAEHLLFRLKRLHQKQRGEKYPKTLTAELA